MERLLEAAAELRSLYPPGPAPAFGATIIGFLVGTLLLGFLFYCFERLFPEQEAQPFLHLETPTNALYWVFDFLVAKRLVTAAAVITLIAAVALRMPRVRLLAHQPLWLQAAEALLVADFCGYWSHRLLHHVPWLWHLHRVHHSSERLDWLASARVHPLEGVWTRLVSLLPLFLLGFSPKITVFLGPLLSIYPIFLHGNVGWRYGWLGYVVASPAFHRWHHACDREAIDKNFSGLLPVFDFVFGTAYFPKAGKPHRYGLWDEQAPAGFWRQLIWPFKRR